jgi:MFS family permease
MGMSVLKEQIKDYLEHIRLFSSNARWYLLASFFMGFGYSIFGLLLNLYLKQLGYQEGTIGSILSASSLGTVLIAIPAAIFVDHMKIKRVLLLATSLSSASFIAMALSSGVWPLRLLSGYAGAMFTVHWVATSPFFMRNSTPRERSYLYGVNMALETTSGFFGTLIGGMVPRYLLDHGVALLYGYRYTLIGGVVLALISLVFYAMLKSAKPTRSGRLRLAEYFGARDWRTVIKIITPHFLVGMGAGLVIPFLNLYFLNRFHLPSDQIGRIFSFGALFTAVGFLAGPVIAKRIGLIKTTVITQFLSIPFFLILAFTHNLHLAIFGFLFRGSLMNLAWPLYNNFAMEMVPDDQRAGTNSVIQLAWNASWMISANVGGHIIQNFGFTAVMLITVGLYVLSTSLAWIFFRRQDMIGRAAAALMIPSEEISGVVVKEME